MAVIPNNHHAARHFFFETFCDASWSAEISKIHGKNAGFVAERRDREVGINKSAKAMDLLSHMLNVWYIYLHLPSKIPFM